MSMTLDQQCSYFNRVHEVGTLVRYWNGAKEGEPSGIEKTRTEARVLGDHTVVVWLEGVAGCVSLSHIEPIE